MNDKVSVGAGYAYILTDPVGPVEVNEHRFQDGNTRTMIFSVAHIVSYVSQFMSLQPGDLISTGTPPGVGAGMKPPVFLKPGQRMRLGIEGLGEQDAEVVAEGG